MAAPTPCRICSGALEPAVRGASAGSPLDLRPTCHRPGAHGDLYRCRECGCVDQPSLPRGVALHDVYRGLRDDEYLAEEAGRRRTARGLLDVLGPPGPRGRLLEVGCGPGLLLDEARARGWDVQGLELSVQAARYARERLGLPIAETPLEAAELEVGSFDAVLLVDVLEHLDDPAGALDRCARALAPDGALLVVTPDPASATARLFGRRWWGYLPAHTCLLPHATLRELVAGLGLVIALDRPYVRSFSPGYWLAGLAERGSAARALGRLARRLPARAQLTLSLGDERVVVARRVEVRRPARPLAEDRGDPVSVHAVLPAYRAAATVPAVAAELPAAAMDRALLVDDASPDATAEVAVRAGLDVLRHPANRGYGANQKTCYVRAALDGADVVVMVHADNQYDPALIPEMVAPIRAGLAEVVIGSRLLDDRAIVGGMPRWKWLGNRALTWIENRGFRRSFSEYHTGYRAFSVDFLRTIPFLRNSDGFVFDQEMFAQAIASGARVVELPIPTRYFLEASSVSFAQSVVYGIKTLGVLARFRRDARRGRWALLRRPAATLTPARPAAGRDAPAAIRA